MLIFRGYSIFPVTGIFAFTIQGLPFLVLRSLRRQISYHYFFFFFDESRSRTKGINPRDVLHCSMVNLDQKLCFLECLSLCHSGSEVGKGKLYELWEAEVNPPCSEHHCRLEAMEDRHRGARAFQFVLELFHCVSTPPSRLPALLTNTSPPSLILAAGNTCLPDSPASPSSFTQPRAA